MKRVHARGRVAPKDGAILFGEGRTIRAEPRSSASSLSLIINLRFFAMGGGADIIVVIGFTRSYDSGLCCFIGSIIPRGVRPRTTPATLNAPRMRDTGSSPLELTVGKN